MVASADMSVRARRGFWQRVDKQGAAGCWRWTGVLNESGYGRFTYHRPDGRNLAARAHRIAYELQVGPIAEGMQLDHLCRNRDCVNPEHLEPVTPKVNTIRGSRFKGGHLERRERDWRVVWRESGIKRYQSFLTETEALAFLERRRSQIAA